MGDDFVSRFKLCVVLIPPVLPFLYHIYLTATIFRLLRSTLLGIHLSKILSCQILNLERQIWENSLGDQCRRQFRYQQKNYFSLGSRINICILCILQSLTRNLPRSFKAWLERINCSQYHVKLCENGWDDIEFLDFDNDDLLGAGIDNQEHREIVSLFHKIFAPTSNLRKDIFCD